MGQLHVCKSSTKKHHPAHTVAAACGLYLYPPRPAPTQPSPASLGRTSSIPPHLAPSCPARPAMRPTTFSPLLALSNDLGCGKTRHQEQFYSMIQERMRADELLIAVAPSPEEKEVPPTSAMAWFFMETIDRESLRDYFLLQVYWGICFGFCVMFAWFFSFPLHFSYVFLISLHSHLLSKPTPPPFATALHSPPTPHPPTSPHPTPPPYSTPFPSSHTLSFNTIAYPGKITCMCPMCI